MRYGVEKGRLVKSLTWNAVLEVRPNSLDLRLNSRRTIEATSYVFLAPLLIGSVFATLFLERFLAQHLVEIIPLAWLRAWFWFYVAGLLALVFGEFCLAILGSIYLSVFVTFPILARFSRPAAVLSLKKVRMGRFRHVLWVSVEKEIVPLNLQEKTLVLTVLATRRGLDKALRRVVIEGSSNQALG